MAKFTEYEALLHDMKVDDYYPSLLVAKIEWELKKFIEWLEKHTVTTEQVQEKLDILTDFINDLQPAFEAQNSEIETVARDSIAEAVDSILETFAIKIDLEEALRNRDW